MASQHGLRYPGSNASRRRSRAGPIVLRTDHAGTGPQTDLPPEEPARERIIKPGTRCGASACRCGILAITDSLSPWHFPAYRCAVNSPGERRLSRTIRSAGSRVYLAAHLSNADQARAYYRIIVVLSNPLSKRLLRVFWTFTVPNLCQPYTFDFAVAAKSIDGHVQDRFDGDTLPRPSMAAFLTHSFITLVSFWWWGYCCSSPPSAKSSLPVTKLLWPEARNSTAPAISSGRPGRPSGRA
jgi:hypothetical protein